jgi:hypothetical protein
MEDNLGDPDVDRRIILKQILRDYWVKMLTGFNWHRIESNGGNFKHVDETVP